ncbi:MAG: DUF4157 domain-containing protein [Chloroflexi bacterium]|nr:DUF4157 domain-containing protein [Chloroflexota bacterium]
MSGDHIFDEKSHIRAKPKPKQPNPHKEDGGQQQANPLSQLQRTAGNAAVQRLIAQRSATGPSELDEDTAQAIQRERGSGQPINKKAADKAGNVVGEDFSEVRVHTDAGADQLSRKLNARAFTTGQDIFFREGEYAPGSTDGDKLISHELTHVAQQGNSNTAVQEKTALNDPNDHQETEADRVADTAVSKNDTTTANVQLADNMEEEEVQAKVQRAEEEEEVQAKLQRQEEEEEVQAKIQREGVDEEELQAKRDH